MKKYLSAILPIILISFSLLAEDGTMMSKYRESGVAESFKVGKKCFPYPEYSNRAEWKKISGMGASSIIKAGEAYLGYQWQHVPAKAFTDVVKSGSHDSKRYETKNREVLIRLATAEAVEGKGRFMKDLADGFWFYTTSYHWTLVNTTGKDILPLPENSKVELGSGRTAQTLSVIWSIFGEEFDKIDPMIGITFKQTVKRLILDPFLDSSKDEKHWWLGKPHTRRLNNHTPWNTTSVLVSFFATETQQSRLDSAICKCLTAVDVYLNDFPKDGLCDEGPTYWFNSVGRLSELLQLLKDASDGKFDVMPNSFISSLGTYISRCCAGQTPKGKEIVANYGDAEPYTDFDASLMWKAAGILGSQELKDLALMSLFNGTSFKTPKLEKSEGYRAFENIRQSREIGQAVKNLNLSIEDGVKPSSILEKLRSKVPASTYFPQGGQLFIKTADNWFFSAKAADNGEAHNHNDAGSCILFSDGIAILVDPGVGIYNSKTFGPHRYELWTMISDWHNIPVINGAVEHQGKQFSTENPEFKEGRGKYIFSVNIQKAYLEEADCKLWKRSYIIEDKSSGSTLEILDEFELNSRKSADIEHFIIQGEVEEASKGKLILKNKDKTFELTFPGNLISYSKDVQTDMDKTLTEVWGKTLTRINLTSRNDAPLKGSYSIKLKAINK